RRCEQRGIARGAHHADDRVVVALWQHLEPLAKRRSTGRVAERGLRGFGTDYCLVAPLGFHAVEHPAGDELHSNRREVARVRDAVELERTELLRWIPLPFDEHRVLIHVLVLQW